MLFEAPENARACDLVLVANERPGHMKIELKSTMTPYEVGSHSRRQGRILPFTGKLGGAFKMKELAGRLVICSILTAPQWSVLGHGNEMATLKEKHSVTEWGNVPRVFWASYDNTVRNARQLANAIATAAKSKNLWQPEAWANNLVLNKTQLGEQNGHALLKAMGFEIVFPPSQFFWQIDYSLVNDSGHGVLCQQKKVEVGAEFARILASPEKLRHGYDGITAFILIFKAQVNIIKHEDLMAIIEEIEQPETMSTVVTTDSFMKVASLLTHDVSEKFDATAPFPSAEEYYAPLVQSNPQLRG